MPHNRPIPVDNLPPVGNAAGRLETVPDRADSIKWIFSGGIVLIFVSQWLPDAIVRWIFVALGTLICVSSIAWVFQWSKLMNKSHEKLLAFVFGVIFIVVLLGVAIFIPEPKAFQYTVFRIVLALAAAGVAAVIPGILIVNVSKWIRAGGALAVFVVVYFYAPAALEKMQQ